MPISLTPGRWRGLKTTSTPGHVFTILAFDQRGSFREMLPDGTPWETCVDIKDEFVSVLSKYSSAVLLDPIYGLKSAMNMSGQSGVLLAIEKSGYSGDSTGRKMELLDNWGVVKIKKVGASAVKLLAYYHPDGGQLTEETEALVQRVIADCHQHDIPIFVEPVSYSLDKSIPKDSLEFARMKPEIVRKTAERFTEFQPDVLKLEFPVDPHHFSDEAQWEEACDAITDIVTVPWALLSAGVDFDIFEKQAKVAFRAGASGFLVGRAIWKEGVGEPPSEREQFIRHTASVRLQRLADLASEFCRPWTTYYQLPEAEEGWFQTYA